MFSGGVPISTRYFELLMAVAQGERAAIECGLCADGFEAQVFLDTCAQHQLAGFAYRRLHEAGLLPLLSEEVRRDLRLFYQSQLGKNILILKEIEALSSRFRAAQEPILVLKGPIFGLRYYGHVAWRSAGDIDVLIREPSSIRHGHDLVEQCGFRRYSHVLISERLTTEFVHHFEYEKGYLRLDLHWALRRQWSFSIDHGRVWKTARTIHVPGGEAVVLSDEYALLLQLLGLIEDIQRGYTLLRSFVDVYYLLRNVETSMNWRSFFDQREEENTARASVQAIDLVLQSLAASQLPVVREEIERRRCLIRARQPASPFTLLGHGAFSFTRKRWGLAAYDGSRLSSIGWWGISLPFRVAASPHIFQSLLFRSDPSR